MNKLFLLFLLSFLSFQIYAQGGVNCSGMAPICTDVGLNFTANAGGDEASMLDPGNNYDCLFGQPNPTWYYFQVATNGDIQMELAAASDIDFIIWGPFSSLSVAQSACGSMGNQVPVDPNNGNIVDCSFSAAAVENPVITGAVVGQVYVMLIANYAGVVQNITLSQTGGSGTTDCDIVTNPPCAVTSFIANVSGCDFATNNYNISGSVEFTNPPSTGSLVFEDCYGNTTVLASAPFNASTVNYTIANLLANGDACTVQVYFTDESTCVQTMNYVAPACISNCPSYELQSSSPTEACGNQMYWLEIQNTGCNGFISFDVVGNYGSLWANEITWTVTSNTSGNIVAQGGPGTDGGVINTSVGPLDPAIEGDLYTLDLFDAFGDGFNGTGGFIEIQEDGVVLTNTITTFTTASMLIVQPSIAVSSSTLTVTTPSGNVSSTTSNCVDHEIGIMLNNTNFCTPVSVDLPWTIICDLTGDLISSGTQTVIVYPQVPTSGEDLVAVTWNATTCVWDISPNNDCSLLDVGNIFTITPDVAALGPYCSSGSENFTVAYLGISGSPNCCSTAGTETQITYSDNQTITDANAVASPFGGVNNAAHMTIPPLGSGGNSTNASFSISLDGYCFDPPSTQFDESYWVTVYVDGVAIFDQQQLNPPGTFNQTFTLADMPNGYNENSTINVYVYPNSFEANGVFTTFSPLASCPFPGDGNWTMGNMSVIFTATYEQTTSSPVNCDFSISAPYTCCTVSPLSAIAPADANVQCLSDAPNVDINSVTNIISDCPAVVAFVSDASDGNTCPEIITRTYSVTDDCGNTTNVTQTITVNDITAPTASNPGGITVECIGDVPLSDIALVTDAADNCTAVPIVEFVSDVSDGNTCPEVITRTYSVTDNCGNSTNVTQTITVSDVTPPTASNPANINTPLAPAPGPDINVVLDEADNCTAVPVVAFVSEQSDGGDCPEVITRIYSVTDDCGNETLVTQLVIIGGGLVPSPTVSANGPICEGEDAVFTIDGLVDAVVTYDIGAGPTTITLVGGSAIVSVPSLSSDVTITLSSIADGTCSSIIDLSATTFVNSNVIPSFASFGPYCQNEIPDALPTTSIDGYTGTWSPSVIDVSVAGIAIYTFTPDLGQCAAPATIEVLVTPLLVPAFLQIDALCLNETAPGLPVLSQGGISGIWTPAIINTSTVGSSTYAFTPDVGQCADVVTMDIEVLTLPTVIFAEEQLITCITNTSGAQIGTAGVVGNTYSWSPVTNLSNPSTGDPIANPSVTTFYTLTVTDASGCSEEGTVTVTVDDIPPVVSITNNTGTSTLTCTLVEISATATGAENYLWDNGLGNADAASIVSPGIYTVTGTSLNGCESSAEIEIIQDNGVDLFVALSESEICSGEMVSIVANSIEASGFNWTVTQYGVTGATNGTVENTISGAEITQLLTVVGTLNGTVDYTIVPTLGSCIGEPQILTVSVLAPSTPSFDLIGPLCIGSSPPSLTSISLEGISGTWEPTTVSTTSVGNTNYTFTPFQNQCALNQNMEISVNDVPVVNFSGDSLEGCAPHTVVLTSNAVGNCQWSIGSGGVYNGNQVSVVLNSAGCYDVTLQVDDGGCTNSLTMANYICLEEDPVADFSASPDLFTDDDVLVSFTNLSSGASSFVWDFGDNNSSTYINPSNLYESTEEGAFITLTAISDFGCIDIAQMIIEYDEQEVYYIPNTFTPDGDNFNQIFTPMFYSGFDPFNFEMLIFNRWGETVFETHNAAIGWDGTHGVKGTKVADGTFTWKITYKNPKTDERKVLVGHVTLIR